MIGKLLTATLVSVAALVSTAFAADLIGQASVIDGDTIEIHGQRIRLWGIDAPESAQLCRGSDSLQYRCGAVAADTLSMFIAGRPVVCAAKDVDQVDGPVACEANETLVSVVCPSGGTADGVKCATSPTVGLCLRKP